MFKKVEIAFENASNTATGYVAVMTVEMTFG